MSAPFRNLNIRARRRMAQLRCGRRLTAMVRQKRVRLCGHTPLAHLLAVQGG